MWSVNSCKVTHVWMDAHTVSVCKMWSMWFMALAFSGWGLVPRWSHFRALTAPLGPFRCWTAPTASIQRCRLDSHRTRMRKYLMKPQMLSGTLQSVCWHQAVYIEWSCFQPWRCSFVLASKKESFDTFVLRVVNSKWGRSVEEWSSFFLI